MGALCEAWHLDVMHPGVKKQALDMQRLFKMDEIALYNTIKHVKKGCSVCQACSPDNQHVRREVQWTLIPDQPIESVAMWVFSMFEVHIGKEVFRSRGPVCGPTQRLRCGRPAAQNGIVSQGIGSHDDSPLADRLGRPPQHLQRP